MHTSVRFKMHVTLYFLGSLLMIIMPLNLHAQGFTIKGTVTDPVRSNPIAGATVGLKNTSTGTVTNERGQYSIVANKGTDTLVISFIGYDKQEIPVNNRTTINIALKESKESLNEVVVVGYGTQRRKDITGSVATLDQKRLQDLPNNNFIQAMKGAVPGLSISLTSADAEGNNNSIVIRGKNSIKASNSPLIILDGIAYNGSISDINPSDIASIDILKDASSAAIYGSRASNGVILITTKKGTLGKPVISYSGSYGIQKIANLPPVLSPEQFYQFKEMREPGSITLSEQAVYDSKKFPNWLDLATRTGIRQQHTLSVRGGTSNVKYYVSGDYLDVKGIAVNDGFKRLSLRANLSVNITNWLTFGTNTELAYFDRSGKPAHFSGNFGAWLFNPLTSAHDSTGKLSIYPWPEDVFFHNPMEPTLANDQDYTYEIISNNYLQVDFPFLKGLSYKLNTGTNIRSNFTDTYYGINTATGLQAQGSMDHSAGIGNYYVIENILSFNRDFGKHHIDFTGLYSYEYTNAKNNSLHAEGFPNDVLTYYQANNALLIQPSATYTQNQLVSQMARVNYNYNGKYLLTITGRRDGFSGFGADKKFGFFPSAAVGWNIMNEPFMQNSRRVLSNLKLRLSYGSNGNQAIDDYQTLAKLSSRPYVNGTTTDPGYIPSSLANPDLGWETTTTVNIGLDFGLFNGRLQGSFDAYKSKTHDLLMSRRIPAMNGIRTVTQNIGKTENKGMELGLNSTNIQTADFKWTTNANISFNRNKIVSLFYAADNKSDTANGWFINNPINVNFGYVYDGVYQEGDDIKDGPLPGAQPGYAKIKDLNGDGQITPEGDRTIIGSLQPSFIWGMGNTFTYRNLSLYIFLHGVEGTSRANSFLSDNNVQSGVRYNTTVKNWWTPDNPTNDFYANVVGATSGYSVPLYQSDAFIRVEDISLSYNFPSPILRRLNMSKLRIYLDARNLFTLTKWTGLDPELDSQTGIPLQKEYTIGLNISL
jgi:TonB-linked SusC/RagA family outer membrane protein